MLNASETILIVEDSSDDALLFSVALERAGIRNRTAYTASYDATLAYIMGEGQYADRTLYPLPGLIFSDVHMPRETGFELVSWLRANESTKDTIVVLMSGSSSPDYAVQAIEVGASYFLRKPVAAIELVEALKSLSVHWLELSE